MKPMKQFNLEQAKAGAKVCTREGLKARIICFDSKYNEFPLIALIRASETRERISYYYENGNCYKFTETYDDLMLEDEQ